MKKIALCVIAALLILACAMWPVGAFDGNDYGGGDSGGSDWGGSDSYSSDSYSSDSYSGSSGGGGGGSGWIVVLFLAVGAVMIITKYNEAQKHSPGRQAGAPRPSSLEGLGIQLPDRTAGIEDIIKGHDPNFSASDFASFTKRVYIDIQTAWCKRDMAPVRVFLHDNLYDATVKQVQAKIDQGVVYHYESMVVNTAYLTSYAKDQQYEYLTVYLNARMIDWQEDENTGAILRGDKTTRWDLRYKMKFMRSVGILTKEATAETALHACPNCGASLEMTSSGKCAYCQSIVTTGQYSWVLSDFGTIRNDTVDEGINAD